VLHVAFQRQDGPSWRRAEPRGSSLLTSLRAAIVFYEARLFWRAHLCDTRRCHWLCGAQLRKTYQWLAWWGTSAARRAKNCTGVIKRTCSNSACCRVVAFGPPSFGMSSGSAWWLDSASARPRAARPVIATIPRSARRRRYVAAGWSEGMGRRQARGHEHAGAEQEQEHQQARGVDWVEPARADPAGGAVSRARAAVASPVRALHWRARSASRGAAIARAR